MQRMLVFVIVLSTAGGLASANLGLPFVLTVLGSMAGVVLALALVPAGDLPVGMTMTDRRTVLAQQQRGDEPRVVAVLGAGSVQQATIDANPEPFWFAGRLTRVSFFGDAGLIAAIDLMAVDPVAARAALQETTIFVTDATGGQDGAASGSGGDVPFWFIKAFFVGFLYFVGGGFVLLAVPVTSDEGLASGATALGVGAVLLAAGEGLRRLLLRRR